MEMDDWWFDWKGFTPERPCPGKVVLMVGAGISIESPTQLPGGCDLTEALLDHLLDNSAASEIKTVFSQCEQWMGRSLPRLEHVLDKAFEPSTIEGVERSGAARELLRIFSQRPPNANHHLIADYLIQQRGWCITTNFDDCIEQAGRHQIPVHVIDPDTKTFDIMHREYGEDWGIIKVHGTIEHGCSGLGATLADLEHGLPEAFKIQLEQVTNQADLMVVAGYSGTDHFDINHWIRERWNGDRSTRLVWIDHRLKVEEEFWLLSDQENREPKVYWQGAFGGMKIQYGPTLELLTALLGISSRTLADTGEGKDWWRTALAEYYTPTEKEKYLTGTRLASSMGLGQLAEEQLRYLKRRLENDNLLAPFEAEIYYSRGFIAGALLIQNYLKPPHEKVRKVNRTGLIRAKGKPAKALLFYLTQWLRSPHSLSLDEQIDAFACLLDIAERRQQWQLWQSKPFRRLGEKICSVFRQYFMKLENKKLPLYLHGRIQMQSIRVGTLFYDEQVFPFGEVWNLLYSESSPPNFYTPHGPAIPGFYLIERSTAREEDRIADLVLANINYVNILLSALRRRWPKGSQSVFKERQKSDGYLDSGEYAVTYIVQLLNESSQIASALNAPHLQILIARAWIRADSILGGIEYWKQQRLYL
ncbi:NAD-dependent SIR2 family protein deacetylase [Xenorhabdus cabanillasii]|uniref:NAD-dependent SIR2 family protein deacetylase n=1 Tax=Xenorhabdus cabanillasii TaxID=351673 RepID=A0A3D9UDH0_9GAMM|nr:SIR2 family protein [Xenorhabdus cabanillasii]REF26413.1 NAD-dependent SIR2 family protein deacetylase [Xenorhabdus cabanillasii]